MKYKYTARTKDGEMQTGFVEAGNQEAAANILTGHELFILSLEEGERIGLWSFFSHFLNRVKRVDLMIFTRQFATLLQSDVPLTDSLSNLYKQTRNPILKETVYEISNDVSAGLTLSQSLQRQSHIFSDFYFNMIRSAEITGRLEQAMEFLADYLEKEVGWQSKIRNAMIYPIFIVVIFLAVATLLLAVVFPALTPVFAESGAELPLLTKILLVSGNFMAKWWWLVILLIISAIGALVGYLKTPEGRIVFNELIIKTPVFGELSKKIYVARFSQLLSVLIKGGIPVAQSLEITGHTIGNVVYRDILHDISERIKAGEMLSSLLLSNDYYFPPLVGQMVAIGENTGRLDEVLGRIANFYNREVENVLSNLTELIQPMLIAVIGIFVGLLFAAVLIPIYNLIQQFKTF